MMAKPKAEEDRGTEYQVLYRGSDSDSTWTLAPDTYTANGPRQASAKALLDLTDGEPGASLEIAVVPISSWHPKVRTVSLKVS
jgi:hypothetical protein